MAKFHSGYTICKAPQVYPYLVEHIREDPVSRELRETVERKDRAVMLGAPDEASFLGWLCRTLQFKKCVEVGTFRGTTALELARSLPADGKLVCLDITDEYLEDGKAAWKKAGVESKIDLRIGPALESLDQMLKEAGETGTFDFAFIDADKVNYRGYYEKCLELLRPGGVIAVDNVLWGGSVLKNPDEMNEDTKAIVELNAFLREDSRVDAVMTAIADGCYLVRKK
uniref:Caffeoyl-CoA O-methyltransferase n=1 Tax=Chromera velia CCMP2878 TaxID=1169474 RepID=A0A0G4HVQ0_9ALVE|mmetsp:Transcript_55699/g.109045  ORF Transcript_55699/g.109045 Transcript_55699/m.109045 type:complete len:226 (-) Transcript_55699:363-1040(-)|eukprot:Cvel_32343.t1-p1 / transcript=Cvel_32343.t1 / gene=Cvel_32343 / organism=Chromera_velia_CCMP2878 / gene_product=Probable caffeoyl-CoA O-methyltransferase At4g26220, putative / transcript_product=Probable caffeoyl-CoA O-methyltransferase At4g26220, putative / location=Cvel_scaffold5013:4603-6242(-) / protein_length=225 / sequence_SO=supercontig / SO=protein_coding / is_pseudo=false